jgi:hypothetical protein
MVVGVLASTNFVSLWFLFPLGRLGDVKIDILLFSETLPPYVLDPFNSNPTKALRC